MKYKSKNFLLRSKIWNSPHCTAATKVEGGGGGIMRFYFAALTANYLTKMSSFTFEYVRFQQVRRALSIFVP